MDLAIHNINMAAFCDLSIFTTTQRFMKIFWYISGVNKLIWTKASSKLNTLCRIKHQAEAIFLSSSSLGIDNRAVPHFTPKIAINYLFPSHSSEPIANRNKAVRFYETINLDTITFRQICSKQFIIWKGSCLKCLNQSD